MSNENNKEESVQEDEFSGPINTKVFENDEWDLDYYEDIETYTKPISKAKTKIAPELKKEIPTKNIPAKFICPLTNKLMKEPTRISGSKFPVAYEKAALYEHFEEFGTDPKTGDYLDDDTDFTQDFALTRQIADFCNVKS